MAALDLFGAATNYLEEQSIRQRFNLSPALAFADRWLALSIYDSTLGYTTGWGEDGTGGHEPASGLGYARVKLPGADWAAPVLDSIGTTFTGIPGDWLYWISSFTQEAVFPVPTGAWGDNLPAGFGIFDTETPGTGNCLIYFAGQKNPVAPIGPPDAGNQLVFFANQIRFGYGRAEHVFPWSTYGSTYETHYWSDDSVKALINHITGRTVLTPASLYLGFYNATTSAETADTGYARKVLNASSLSAPAADGSGHWFVRNSTNLDWGPVVTPAEWSGYHTTLWDAATGGNRVMHNGLQGFAPAAGDTLRIPADSQTWKFY